MNLAYFICGSVIVFADYEQIVPILNLCMYYCIPYDDFKSTENGVSLRFRLSAFRKLKKEAHARGFEFEVKKMQGIPSILERYKHRYGILLGVTMACALVFLSQQFVWDIDVVGNEKITSSEVREILNRYDFSVGSYIPSVNTDKIENKLLIDSENISWISINIIGTVAEVQIRERASEEKETVSQRPANLVAEKSGIVQEVRIYKGNVIVKSGDFVEKGDLLVSGLFDSERVGFRYTRSAGEVYAKTTTEYFIEIPYKYEEIEYTGSEYCDQYLNFFDLSIKISKNSGKKDTFYDKIDIVENYALPDGTSMPFSIHTVKYLEYEKISKDRDRESAEELAYFRLSEELSKMAEDSVIIRKTITPRVGEKSFSLYCVVVAIENIAVTSEFDVDMSIIGEEKGDVNEQ